MLTVEASPASDDGVNVGVVVAAGGEGGLVAVLVESQGCVELEERDVVRVALGTAGAVTRVLSGYKNKHAFWSTFFYFVICNNI